MVDEALARFKEALPGAGLFLDFDGTLSEIVHVPSAARPVEGVVELMGALARELRLVAVVSGRSATELLEWLGADIEIWGVHGAQRAKDGVVALSDEAAAFEELMGRVIREARDRVKELAIPGAMVEDKGVMVGLHFRAAEDPDAAAAALDEVAADLAERHGLTRAGGRLAYELRPPHDFSKATVVLQRAREESLDAAAFVGDDRVDLPAFDALDVLAAEGVTTLRVAVRSDEAPPELIRRADMVVEGPRGVVVLLRRLLE